MAHLRGGYLFDRPQHLAALAEAKSELQSRYGLHLFVEPGAAMVRRAGCFVASVVDLFVSNNIRVAVLDTSVNHMPEVFEYQLRPSVAGDLPDAPRTCQLAGSICLAGDIFGVYRFTEKLEIGSQLVFENMRAYSMVKANMFNGINLPSIYARTTTGELVLRKRFGFEDFLTHCGAENNAGL